MDTLKSCSQCHEDKTLADFYRNKSTKDGVQSYCKKCAYNVNKRYVTKMRSRANPEQQYSFKDERNKREFKDIVKGNTIRLYVDPLDLVKEWTEVEVAEDASNSKLRRIIQTKKIKLVLPSHISIDAISAPVVEKSKYVNSDGKVVKREQYQVVQLKISLNEPKSSPDTLALEIQKALEL